MPRLVLKLLLVLPAFFVLGAIRMPLGGDLAALILLLGLAWWLRIDKLALISGSALIGLLFLEAGVAVTGIETFYRPHEKYARSDQRYASSVEDRFQMPYGDLVAIAGPQTELGKQIATPRSVTFRTDSRGYRNDADFAGQRYLLLGDSFAAGVGGDQADSLAALLSGEQAMPSYALAYPGDPRDYLLQLERNADLLAGDTRFIFFLFEGNDFRKPAALDAAVSAGAEQRPFPDFEAMDAAYQDIKRPFYGWLRIDEVLLGLRRVVLRKSKPRPERILLQEVGGEPMGFYSAYAPAYRAEALALDFPLSAEAAQRTACLVFIPSKLRVYEDLIPGFEKASGNAALEAARAAADAAAVPLLDLTPALKAEAARALPEGETVFWRDDSHWNGRGARVAAAEVAKNCRN